MSNWSDFLRLKMEEKDWDAARLAQAAGYSPSVVSRWLSGEHLPSHDKLRATVDALGANILEAMLAAGFIRPDEIGATISATDPDLLSDEEILRQVQKRMGAGVKPVDATSDNQPTEVDEKQSDYDLVSYRKGETAERRRRRLEGDFEDHPQDEGPEFGA